MEGRCMKMIYLNINIATIVKEHPEVKDILFNLGFTEIVKPQMLLTVARFMTIKQGCKMRNIDFNHVLEVFKNSGFELKEE